MAGPGATGRGVLEDTLAGAATGVLLQPANIALKNIDSARKVDLLIKVSS